MDEPDLALGTRADALERLGSREFDLLVIGGGVVGAGIAEAASAHGLDVALVDKGDFGGATSSASSKLIHGGLRYLRLGDVGLVREAHQERRLLMRVVAPHLVRRLPFLFPLYDGGPYRPWFVQSGIVLYSTLARARLNGLVGVERARRIVPPLKTSRLRSCALYADAWTNDGRLTLANVRAAAERGSTVLNYAEVVDLRGREGADVVVDGVGPVRATFCGLRVLPVGEGGTANARRETVFSTGPSGMVSVAGGKLTTYRRIALDALDHLGVRGLSHRPRPLPGASGLDHIDWPVELEPAVRAHLLHLYGSLAPEVLAPAADDPSLLEPLVPGRPDLRAQELYARPLDWALTEDDVLRRRTTGWLATQSAPV